MRNSGVKTRKRRHASHFKRYRQIALVLVKYRLGEFIRTLHLESFLPFHMVPPSYPWHKETYTRSQRARMAMEELGTTFIKVGQILSTRSDILPPDFVLELTKLQSSLEPIPFGSVEKVIKDQLGRPVGEIFKSFDAKPLGVASIGQAHAATLADGTEVVVKIQKPGVKELVKEDLEILSNLAESASERWEGSSDYDLATLVEEIADTLNGELDYIREGHSAEHFAKFFQEDASVHIPKVFWEYTTPYVITLERIKGISVLDTKALDAAKLDRKDLAKRCVDLWVKMVFRDNVFHADPHPGNIFVEADGRLGLVDFGMIGVVDDEIRGYLVSAVSAILSRDVDLLIDSLVDLGAITPAASRENLRKDLKHIMGHFPAISEDLHLTSNLGELFAVIRSNHAQLPGNSFLLLKTMSMAQGLGRNLDPEFDFFAALEPSVQQIVKERYRPSSILKQLPPAAAEMALLGVSFPKSLARLVKSAERGQLHFNTDVSGVERHLEHLERLVNRVIIGFIIGAAIFGSAIVFLAFRLGH